MSKSAVASTSNSAPIPHPRRAPKYPGVRVTCNGNQLVAQHVETRITDGGIFYPITPSTEGGEIYQQSYAFGELNVWGGAKVAVETEGEHAAQGGATAFAVSAALYPKLAADEKYGSHLHHRDVVGVALRRLERDLAQGEASVFDDLSRELRNAPAVSPEVRPAAPPP
mgnify:CR=1 FL=1